MNITDQFSATPRIYGSNASLAEWAESLADRIQAGERVDLSDLAREDPERADELRRLLPAIELMAEFGRSAVTSAAAGAGSSRGPGPGLSMTYELDVLGDFRIVREVGRGGMGVVYEAEQISLRRRVALKILPFAAAMDPRQLQRFQLEAQAAACLHHTNIVPIHAVGSERGVSFYAMQFIEGRSLAQVITELRRLDGVEGGDDPAPGPAGVSQMFSIGLTTSSLATSLISGKPPPDRASPDPNTPTVEHTPKDTEFKPSSAEIPESNTPPSRKRGPSSSASSTHDRAYIENVAGLGLQVAEALDHAHDHGILHRDIKPANLMLDAAGHLWVTDFGLAQIRGDSRLTPTGDVLGTLRYMSPEQAMGRRVVIDGRTDVYSLGVSLYELLTLRPAIDGRDRAEILRRVVHEDPPPPRKLNPAIPRDLETIVQKSMTKEPESRYATARELANDLRHFLDDRPISARRPGVPERALRWMRRHHSVAAATAIALVLAVLGSAISTVLIAREQRQTAGALAQAESVLDFFNEVLFQASPYTPHGGALTVKEMMDLAESKLDGRFPDEPLVDASIRFTLGKTFAQQGEYGRARKHLIRSVEIRRRHLGDDDPETLQARAFFAWTENVVGKSAAVFMLQEVLDQQRRVLGRDHPDTIETTWRLAHILTATDRKMIASDPVEETFELSRRVRGPHDEVTLNLAGLVGENAYRHGDYETAKTLLMATCREMKQSQRSSLYTLWAQESLAWTLWARGELREAQQEFERVGEQFATFGGPKTSRTIVAQRCAILLLRQLGEHKRARTLIEERLQNWKKLFEPDHSCVMFLEGLRDLERGEHALAIERMTAVIRWRPQPHNGVKPQEEGMPVADLPGPGGFVGLINEDWPEYRPDKYVQFDTKLLIAEIHAARGEVDAAMKLTEDLIAICGFVNTRYFHDHHYRVAVLKDLLARLCATTAEEHSKLREVPRALSLAQANVAAFPRDGRFLATMGMAQYRVHKWDEAIGSLNEANKIDEGRRVVPRCFFLAMAHWQKGEKEPALALFQTACDWMVKSRSVDWEFQQARAEAAALLEVTDPFAESK